MPQGRHFKMNNLKFAKDMAVRKWAIILLGQRSLIRQIENFQKHGNPTKTR